MARIQLNRLKVAALIGVYPFERTAPQTLEIDLAFDTNTDIAEAQDSLAHTVDYADVAAKIREIAAASSCKLIEALGRTLLVSIQLAFPISNISITLTKFGCIPSADGVSVTLTSP